MPFETLDINSIIEENRKHDPDFKKAWDESREEYRLIGEMTALRKEQRITQEELAERMGSRQQVISRIEKRGSNPSLKSVCNILNALGYELQIVKRENV